MPFTPEEFAKCQAKELAVPLTAEDCTGKTYIITGAYSGIGYECAKHLLKLQAARVIIAVRDLKRGEAAKKTLEKETARENAVEVYQLDLSSYDSVKAFAERVKKDVERVDGLLANAAIGVGSWTETEGQETSLVVNFISTVLVVSLLIPHLEETGKTLGIKPVITFLGSSGVFLAPKPLLENVDQKNIFGDLNERSKWEPLIKDRYVILTCQLSHDPPSEDEISIGRTLTSIQQIPHNQAPTTPRRPTHCLHPPRIPKRTHREHGRSWSLRHGLDPTHGLHAQNPRLVPESTPWPYWRDGQPLSPGRSFSRRGFSRHLHL